MPAFKMKSIRNVFYAAAAVFILLFFVVGGYAVFWLAHPIGVRDPGEVGLFLIMVVTTMISLAGFFAISIAWCQHLSFDIRLIDESSWRTRS